MVTAGMPVLAGFLLVLSLFALGAGLAGLFLDRAARHPRTAAGMVAAMIGLSWGGSLLLGE
ncbi:hypothetical protein CR162_10090 [Pseudoroseomonas rhizosphaerae]|uniref:Uncharacterized protein n=1 Tax=Teichococcus rhizosphaerae TaxID=1335062 RepID=A0A2C7A9M1_9PROT|nr:hypothetical protein [Pseudoroseomonas rhizosphaerae]PHK95090.1 hypothetical protein CR162_10090 [Pseudoroseomonas rhizosphaerae]